MDALVQMVSHITKAKRQKRTLEAVGVFLDMDKAFERGGALPAVAALARREVHSKLLRWIQQWITNRAAQVRIQGHYSQCMTMENGVPQGSVLSPIVFGVILDSVVDGVKFPAGMEKLLYADDLTLVAVGSKACGRLQEVLDQLRLTLARHGLCVSATKTSAIQFYTRGPRRSLKYGTKDIQFVTKHKYLGIVLDTRLTFAQHITKIRDSIAERTNILKILGGCTGASTKVLKNLYTALIQAKLDYGAPVVAMASTYQLKRLDVIQREALRVVLGVPRWTRTELIHLEADVEPISRRYPFLMVRFAAAAMTKARPPQVARDARAEMEKDSRVFRARTWARTVGFRLQGMNLPMLTEQITHKWPPWQACPMLVILPNKGLTKQQHAEKMRDEALSSLTALSYLPIIFTDGSKTSDATGWAAVSQGTCLAWGRSDRHTPIVQGELEAIRAALNIAADREEEVVIASDSPEDTYELPQVSLQGGHL